MKRRGTQSPFRNVSRTHTVADLTRCRVAVVADTHARPHPALPERLAALAPDLILHAGDIGAPEILDALAEHAPVVAVRGNIDGRDAALPDAVALTLRDDEGARLRIYLIHVGVRAWRLSGDVRRRSKGADLVVCGHSHVPLLVRDGDVVVFNPGSSGPRRFGLPIVFGVIELGPDGASLHHVDCETGARWQPTRP